MLVLTIRTDKPDSEVGLFNGNRQVAYVHWRAHRQLAETLHQTVKSMLDERQYKWHDVQAVVAYKGPGSFTGLRIGLSLANALADSLTIPIVGTSGADWLAHGIAAVQAGKNQQQVQPLYGSEPHITQPKK